MISIVDVYYLNSYEFNYAPSYSSYGLLESGSCYTGFANQIEHWQLKFLKQAIMTSSLDIGGASSSGASLGRLEYCQMMIWFTMWSLRFKMYSSLPWAEKELKHVASSYKFTFLAPYTKNFNLTRETGSYTFYHLRIPPVSSRSFFNYARSTIGLSVARSLWTVSRQIVLGFPNMRVI